MKANFGKMEGLVYDCLEEEENVVTPFDLPNGTVYYAGIDWGYTDPFALVIHGIIRGAHTKSVNSRSQDLPLPISMLLEANNAFYIQTIYADPSQPD